MKGVDPVVEKAIEEVQDWAALAREYRAAKLKADAARESVKPATKAATDARAALVGVLKASGISLVVDGRLYRIAGNGQFVEEDVEVVQP